MKRVKRAPITPEMLIEARRILGHGQRQAAREIGCGARTILRWETGETDLADIGTMSYRSLLGYLHRAQERKRRMEREEKKHG